MIAQKLWIPLEGLAVGRIINILFERNLTALPKFGKAPYRSEFACRLNRQNN